MQTNHTAPEPSPSGDGFTVIPEMESALEALNLLNESAVKFVREQPVACMLTALGVGFVIAKIADRF